ncbi:Response regulator receiver domain-containing protein [Desulfonatronum thiosulfatophilum]|uniref:Response regulator receiver domain-containing protein n=2 Tax=Desulfonatronum thiosulfatophilum TaxID=617002 RepID=A0A1G6C211_9BACT|nr:Response regulator receiver domain-containing protein [Desulfonatronum thiosulfatophilum]
MKKVVLTSSKPKEAPHPAEVKRVPASVSAVELLPSYVMVTSNETNYELDRENLRKVGMVLNCRLTSSSAVLDYIRHNSIKTIVLDSAVSGCHIHELVFQIRKYLRGTPMNLIVISDTSDEGFVIDTITAGCTGFIIRPYTLETLTRHARVKQEADAICINEEVLAEGQSQLHAGNYAAAIEGFEEIVAGNTNDEHDEARKYFDLGNQFLMERKFGKAIVAFNKALRMNHLFIKAYEGLAESYKGKGDLKNCQLYLQKAADEYARMDNFADVKRIFAKITKYDIHAPNAYNTLGIELRHKKMYVEAIHAYINALKLTPKDENIYYNLAKAQMFSKRFSDALSSIRECLFLNENHSEALELYKFFTKVEWLDDKNARLEKNVESLHQA